MEDRGQTDRFNPGELWLIVTHTHAKNQGQMLVRSETRVVEWKRADGRTDMTDRTTIPVNARSVKMLGEYSSTCGRLLKEETDLQTVFSGSTAVAAGLLMT